MYRAVEGHLSSGAWARRISQAAASARACFAASSTCFASGANCVAVVISFSKTPRRLRAYANHGDHGRTPQVARSRWSCLMTDARSSHCASFPQGLTSERGR
jgi:hypothetical protein